MADDHDPNNTSQISDQGDVLPAKEDAETAATRKELKHTAISEQRVPDIDDADDSSSNNDKTPPRSKTPDDSQSEALREQVGSPKKKRAISEVEADKEEIEADLSLDSAASPPPGSRTTRSEPEKKRPRDDGTVGEAAQEAKSTAEDKSNTANPISTESLTPPVSSDKHPTDTEKPVTSNDAFKKSGFSAMAGAQSPFASSGPVTSVFGGNASGTSPFATPSSGTKSVFGGGGSTSFKPTAPVPLSLSNTSSTSPFGSTNGSSGSSFASSAFGGFGSTGSKLSSFATPGQLSLSKNEKHEKRAFGAPESDAEDDDEGEGSDKDDENGDATSSKENEKEGSQPPIEEKKKPKLQKVQVDDGEAGEATLVSVRSKIYALDKSSNSWKERGMGNLKVNAPMASVDLDERGSAIPGSFDASTLQEMGDSEGKGPRLIMRQEHTHRVILNAAIVPTMKFTQRDSLKAAHLVFQTFEETGVVTLQLKMSVANAKEFLKEVESVQQELSS